MSYRSSLLSSSVLSGSEVVRSKDTSVKWHVDVSYLGKHGGFIHSLLAVVNGGSRRCIGLFLMVGRDFKGDEIVSCLGGLLVQVEEGLLLTKRPESVHVDKHPIFKSPDFVALCEAHGLRIVSGGKNTRNPVENFFHRFKTACVRFFELKTSPRTWRSLKSKYLTASERRKSLGVLSLSRCREKLFSSQAFFKFLKNKSNLDHLLVELNLRRFEGLNISRLTLDVVLVASSKRLLKFSPKSLMENPTVYLANSAMRGDLLSKGRALEVASGGRVDALSLEEARDILNKHDSFPESILSVLLQLAVNVQNLNVGQSVGFTNLGSEIGGLKSQVEKLTSELEALSLKLKRQEEAEDLKAARRKKRNRYGREVPTESILTAAQFEKLVPYVGRQHPESLMVLRHRLTAVLLYATGMRIRNCLTLTVDDVKNLYNANPAFYPWRVKTKNERRIYISSERRAVVLNHKREFLHYARRLGLKNTSFVFVGIQGKNKGKVFSRSYFTDCFNRYMKQMLGSDRPSLKQSSKGFRMG